MRATNKLPPTHMAPRFKLQFPYHCDICQEKRGKTKGPPSMRSLSSLVKDYCAYFCCSITMSKGNPTTVNARTGKSVC
ncbi:hypothetical protein I7I50_00705 [Histoplasma capsulatum G186AR]|uniref:Uncharacterized protein n=1 Tax=Ajellomyces capsulatus TaxID=5037 RepID=A0A8H7YJF2_AJECA|nr:hypothetical protein I7I52_07973 [Histoplasma capsulatum]QSS72762.1 hypothetical protein I7I50_00705 [Histoplasma capsulatum G186AR]